MTATERLRALLDDRGVDWEAWNDRITVALPDTHYLEITDGTICAVMVDCTPEQAIEATLGRGTCRMEGSWHGTTEVYEYRCMSCDEYAHIEVVKPDGAQPPRYCPSCGRVVGE